MDQEFLDEKTFPKYSRIRIIPLLVSNVSHRKLKLNEILDIVNINSSSGRRTKGQF